MATLAIFLLLVIKASRELGAAYEENAAPHNCAFPVELVRDVTLNILQASHVVLYVGEGDHSECTVKVSRALHDAGMTILAIKQATRKDAGLSLSSALDAHAFKLSRMEVLCFVSSLQSTEMKELHRVVSSSVLYRYFRYTAFLPSAHEPLENSLGACRLLAVTPLEGDKMVFDVKRANLLSDNCTQLDTYAHWNNKTAFDRPVSPIELSPIIRNYWGKQLRFAYVEHAPFSISRPLPNGTVVYEGVDFKLMPNLARTFNMSLVPVRNPDSTWGGKRHGRWTGMAGMVHRREVDMAVSGFFQTPHREEVLDYTHYYDVQPVKFIVRAPEEKPRALVIIRPFTVEVWLGVLVSYMVCLAMFLALMRFERRHDRSRKLRFLPAGDVALSLYLAIIWQGGDRRFSGSPTRRLVATGWWMLCTVISCAYCSLLISFMSHPGMEQALDTLPRLRRELLAGRMFVGTTRHSELEFTFTGAKEGIMRDIGRQMLEHPQRTLVATDREGYRRCMRSRFAYMFPEPVLKVEEARTNGRLLVSREAFYHGMAVYTFPKGSPNVATFSYGMKNCLFMGLIKKWLNDYLWQLRMNTKHDETGGNTERPISVVDLQGAFFIVVIGCASGFLALLTESCCAFLARLFATTIRPYYSRGHPVVTG